MAEEQPDLAFNAQLWAYRTGIVNRRKELIVRIRNGSTRTDVKVSNLTLTHRDSTNAGTDWSAEELDTAGCQLEDLVLVIGQLLPERVVTMRKDIPNSGPFDPDIHAPIDPINDTFTVVKRLQDQRVSLYRLIDKKGGLCSILPFPRHEAITKRLVYYDEWTVMEPYLTTHASRSQTWNKHIRDWCLSWLSEDPRWSGPASSSRVRTGPTNNEVLATEGSSELEEHSPETVDANEPPRNQSTSWESDRAVYLRSALFEASGMLENNDANELVELCKENWPEIPPPVEPIIITPLCLVVLCQGLREGALGDTTVDPNVHDLFIRTWCKRYAKDPFVGGDHVRRMISQAYQDAMAFRSKSPSGPVIDMEVENFKAATLTSLRRLEDEQKELEDEHKRLEDRDQRHNDEQNRIREQWKQQKNERNRVKDRWRRLEEEQRDQWCQLKTRKRLLEDKQKELNRLHRQALIPDGDQTVPHDNELAPELEAEESGSEYIDDGGAQDEEYEGMEVDSY